MSKKSKLKIIPLGGMGEIGKNINVIEYEDDIILICIFVTFFIDNVIIKQQSVEKKLVIKVLFVRNGM